MLFKLFILVCVTSPILAAPPTTAPVKEIESPPSSTSHDFQLRIRPQEAEVAEGDPVKIVVELKNVTSHDVWYSAMSSDVDVQFSARNPKDEELPLTEAGKMFQHIDRRKMRAVTSLMTVRLKPGQHVVEICYLNRYFDLSPSGSYRIAASIEVPKDGPPDEDKDRYEALARSNAIEIGIVPRWAKPGASEDAEQVFQQVQASEEATKKQESPDLHR